MTDRPQGIVLVDTNVIIEAHRLRCWNRIAGSYEIITSNECIEECSRGRQSRTGYVKIEIPKLKSQVRGFKVKDIDRARLELKLQSRVDLDQGEKDLLALFLTIRSNYMICSSDKAALRAGYILGIIDKYISLEELVFQVGQSKVRFREQYTQRWLETQRMDLKLEIY